jgi:hypothetical protein
MSDTSITVDALGRRRRGPQPRRRIALPNGDHLEPRAELAGELGISDRTAARMNLPTTYIGNVAYVAHGASMAIIAARVRRPNQPEPPPKRRRAR